jgi:alpha-amylase/alpha-mannosidase (GH57 family)
MTVKVAFLWHQHQPFYKDLLSGEYAMPWVRLHALKDYWSMPLIVESVPGMQVTFNLVPSLIVQIQDYADGKASDRWLDVMRRPADGLDRHDALFILDRFFSANRQTMIDPYPRYRELHRRRRFAHATAERVLPDFAASDLRDLQVWSLLAWCHPLTAARFEVVRDLLAKGRDFTEADKAALIDAQQAVLGEVLPLHRRLADAGVIELTTSPFYHPILPLLVDMDSAREAMPGVALPAKHRPVPEDARAQVEKAVALFETTFGRRPAGMWPSEGAVSQGMLPIVARGDFQWIAGDEEVLAQSLGRRIRREAGGPAADALYRPYRVAAAGAELTVVFRDHLLSDLIGFQYRYADPQGAADDFVRRLSQIGRDADDDGLVLVVLDGENAWEHYAQQGLPFLRALYQRVLSSPGVRPVQVSEYLKTHPAAERLPRLAAGSWINHDFAIWVGQEEDNRAWDYVFTTREFLTAHEAEASAIAPAALATAWESLYAAEGSDWYWWYGPEHSSGQDEEFDHLFRTHLRNVYAALGAAPPPLVDMPVLSTAKLTAYTWPKSFLDVHVDGRDSDYFEWLDAGHYSAASRYGAMRRTAPQVVTDLHFGFNEETLFIRLATHGPLRALLGRSGLVHVVFREPREVTVAATWSDDGPAMAAAAGPDDEVLPAPGVQVAAGQTFEVAVPFAVLGAKPGDLVQFAVEVGDAEGLTERLPESGAITFVAPSEDFEQINWQA